MKHQKKSSRKVIALSKSETNGFGIFKCSVFCSLVALYGGLGTAFASCGDAASGTNGIVFANGGSNCDATHATYSGYNAGYATGATLTFTQSDVSVISSGGSGVYGLSIGGANIGGTPQIPGASIHALGNLTLTGNNGANSRALFIYNGGSGAALNQFLVDGNLIAHRSASSTVTGGATIQVAGENGYIRVNETTLLDSPNTDIFRNAGNGDFLGNTTIQTTSAGSGGGIGLSNSSGALTFHQDLIVATRNGDAINMTGGSISVLGDSTLSSQAGRALAASGASTQATFNTLSAETFGTAAAVYATQGATISAGAASTVKTSGNSAHAIVVDGSGSVALGATAVSTSGAQVTLSSGTITTTGIGANGVHVTTTTGDVNVVQGGTSSISAGGDGIHVVSTSGAITIEADNVSAGQTGISTDTDAGTSVSIKVNNGTGVASTSGVAILDKNGDATVTLASGSKINGAIRLGNGNDSLLIQGNADITGSILDGGNATDSSVTDILNSANAATNKLTIQDSTRNLTGANLLNWQTVTLNNSSVVLSDGLLTTGSGFNPDASRQGLVLSNASTLTSPVALSITGDVTVDATSVLSHALGGNISANVNNAGLIKWSNLGQTLTIGGNYTGVSGSQISLETMLGGDTSVTDRMVVVGNTSGQSSVIVRPASGSLGAQTSVGINVIGVGGTSDATFSLANTVQAGAYQYVLKKGGNGGNASDWYLVSFLTVPTIQTEVPIYRPGVGAYVAAQAANAEEGFQSVTTFHERRGENTIQDQQGRRTWIRPYWQSMRADGERRFSYSGAKLGGLQVGQEIFSDKTETGTAVQTAVTFDYVRTDAHLNDRFRPHVGLDSYVGRLAGDSYSIGATHSREANTGAYLDIVGKLTVLRNKFSVIESGTALQTGTRGTLSVEVGKPYSLNKDWVVEPQAQAIYMRTRYSDFADSISKVGGYTSDALRGRLGVRITNLGVFPSDGRTRLYGLFDILHDFLKSSELQVADTRIGDDFRRSGFAVGLGVEHKVGTATSIYARSQYSGSLGREDFRGYSFSVGVKSRF